MCANCGGVVVALQSNAHNKIIKILFRVVFTAHYLNCLTIAVFSLDTDLALIYAPLARKCSYNSQKMIRG